MSVIKKLTRQAMNGREKIQMWQEVSAYDDDDQYSQFVGGLSHVEDPKGDAVLSNPSSRASSAGYAPRARPKSHGGLWKWKDGSGGNEVEVRHPFPDTVDPRGPRLRTPEARPRSRSSTGSGIGGSRGSKRPGSRGGGALARLPKPARASPTKKRGSKRAPDYRKWSEQHMLSRPRTPDVLWPAEARAYRPPPRRRPQTQSALTELDASLAPGANTPSVVPLVALKQGSRSLKGVPPPGYSAEHLGFATSDQGHQLLAGEDAKRIVKNEERRQRRLNALAAKQSTKAAAFSTSEARFVAAEPEVFALRVVKADKDRKQRKLEARLATQREKDERARVAKEAGMLRQYELDRSLAIIETLALPNVGRTQAAWKRFRRLLRMKAQRDAQRNLMAKWKGMMQLPQSEWQEEVATIRQQSKDLVKAARKNNGALLESTLDYAAEFDASVFDELPGTDENLPVLDGLTTKDPFGDDRVVEEDALANRLHTFDAYAQNCENNGGRGLLSRGGIRTKKQIEPYGTERADLARHAFTAACRRMQCAPLPVMPSPYLLGTKKEGYVDLHNKHIGDKLAIAVVEGLQAVSTDDCRVQHVNLSGNGLTEAIVPAIAGLFMVQESFLTILNLSKNSIGPQGCGMLGKAIAGNIYIQELQLGNCNMRDSGAQLLMPVIAELSDLLILNISSNKLTPTGASHVGDMLERTLYLEVIDLSWNTLGPRGCGRVITALSENKTLKKLNLAWNSAQDAVMRLEEVLQDGVLEEIDLSSNNIGEKQAQVLSGLLKRSKLLKRVSLAHNPIGVRGGRAIFKSLLVLETNGINVDLSGCNLGAFDENLRLFDPGNPNGQYSLQLSDPYDEFVAMELVELAWVEEGENWENEQLDGKPYDLKEPEDLGIEFGRTSRLVDFFELPEEGTLSLRYASTRRRPKMGDEATDKQMDTFIRLMSESAMAAELALKAACAICYLTVSQAKVIVNAINLNAGDRVDAVIFMLPRIIDAEKIPQLMSTLTDAELDTLSGRVGVDFFHFCPKNPTGRYKLDLKDEFDWLVAQSLLDFTNDEALFCERNGIPDVSQHGGYSGAWRNCTLDQGKGEGPQPFVHSKAWKLPTTEEGGILRLDYSTTNRPSRRAKPIMDRILENLLEDMAAAYNRVQMPPKAAKKKDGGRRKKKGGSDEDKIEACIPATAESATPGTAKKERGGMKRRLRRISVTAIGFESALGPDGVQGEPEPEPEPERDPSELQGNNHVEVHGQRPQTPPRAAEQQQQALTIEAQQPEPEPEPEPGAATDAETPAHRVISAAETGEGPDAPTPMSPAAETPPGESPASPGDDAVSVAPQEGLDLDGDGEVTGTEIAAKTALDCITGHDEQDKEKKLGERRKHQSTVKNTFQDGVRSVKSQLETNFTAGGRADRGVLEMGGGRNNRRPPWAVPLRPSYPVRNEAERQRVGAALACQLLKRSTFSYFYSGEQIQRLVGWLPKGQRAEAAVTLFGRCLKMEDFKNVEKVLTIEEIHELKERLGAMAVMNPYNPDGPYELDLRVYDQRKVALMLIYLADGEPGENWQEESIDGRALDITRVWMTDEGMPKKGIMRLRYVTEPHCAVPACASSS